MNIVISIEKSFNNYELFKKHIKYLVENFDVEELRSSQHNTVIQFNKKNKDLIKMYEIPWNDLSSGTIKLNNYGKEYNADAPSIMAQNIIDGATHYIIFGKGDYNINKFASKELEEVIIDTESVDSKKIYKF